METLAAVEFLRAIARTEDRVVNVIDVLSCSPRGTSPWFHRRQLHALFTRDRPVIFAYHGYPYLIHRLTYKRSNHQNIHVHGFREEGTTTTPFDMVVLNRLDRFHLALNAISRLPRLGEARVSELTASLEAKLDEHAVHIREHGEDMPEIQRWTWMYGTAAEAGD